MIGGRVLDSTAVVGFSTGQSVYAEALLVMTAIEETIVLAVPSAVLSRASALIPRGHELGLPCTVVAPLDTGQVRAVGAVLEQGGEPRGDIAAAHAVHCAQKRGGRSSLAIPNRCSPHLARLVDQITDKGDLRSPQWRDALLAIPPHLFIPRRGEDLCSERTPWSPCP